MAKAIQITEHGGAEKLQFVEVADQPLQPNEVRLRQTAIGVNYIDIYYRTGLYKAPLPSGLGIEATGVIEEVGEAVQGFAVGERVAYGTVSTLLGAYSTHRNIDANNIVKVPEHVSDEIAAVLMLKGMTAHMLCQRVIKLQPEWNVLVHAAAGGVGTLVAQWAKFLGCNVIGTVGSPEKEDWARKNGCAHVINYTTHNFTEKVAEITNGMGAQVVYDAVGAATFAKSVESLATFGLLCSYGQSSGRVEPFDILELGKKSAFITRPSVAHYKKDVGELRLSAFEVFNAVKENVLRPHISHRIPLAEAAEAHKLLESRQTMGAIVLVP